MESKKRARTKRAAPLSTWDDSPLDVPQHPDDPAWTKVCRRWKLKHSASKRRRWAKRERLHAKWLNPAKKRARKVTHSKNTLPARPDFWTPFCRDQLNANFWMPAGELVDTVSGDTAPTWFDTCTHALPAGREVPYDQAVAARRVCRGIKNAAAATKAKDTPADGGTKAKVFFMKPSKDQRDLLSKFMGGTRYCHNKIVAAFNVLDSGERDSVTQKDLIRAAKLDRGGSMVETGELTAKGKKKKTKVQSDCDPWLEHAPKEFIDVPYIVRKNVARNLIGDRKSWSAKKCNKGKELKFRERTGKEPQESFYIEQCQINVRSEREHPGVSNLRSVFGTEQDRSAFPSNTKFPERVDGDCRVVYNRVHDKWKVVIPTELEHRKPNHGAAGNVVSIDPGIRVFATCFDLGRKKVVEWGKRGGRAKGEFGGTELIEWLCRKTDRLQSRSAQARTQAERDELNKQANVVREKIRHLVDEFHHKLAVWLCENYEVVLLPKFGVKRIMQRRKIQKRRAIGRKTCRKLAQLSHGRFREFLLHKAREYGTTVVVCDECYTSCTCTACGRTKADLGKADVFACAHCGSTHGRDAGAARNILLRYMALQEKFLKTEPKADPSSMEG